MSSDDAGADPQILALLQKAADSLQSLAEKSGAVADEEKEQTDQRQTLQSRLWRSLQDGTRAVGDFARALLPIPATLGQLGRQALMAGAPTALTTLQKSWSLVIGQLAEALMPAIARVV